MMGSKSSAPPPPPNYAAAAQQTAQGNIETAQLAQTQNMVNQVTPQGTVTYTPNQIGTTSSGAPINQWTQTVALNPQQQAMYQQNQDINQQLGNVAQQGLGYVQSALNQPLSFDSMQALQAPGDIQQQASDAAYQNATRYLDPQFQQQQAALESKLANQGITRGSEAWNTAMNNAAMQKEQAYGQARNQAYLQGMQGANQMFGQSLGTRQQQINEAQTLQQNPLNMLNAVRTGQQMQVTNQPQVATSSPGQMATTAGPDMLGAANAQYNAQLANYNAQQAGANNMMGGLFGLGSASLGNTSLFASDPVVKENIQRIGELDNGLILYTFEYKDEYKDEHGHGTHIGVMADEVEKLMPEAIEMHPDGYRMVNYAKVLNAIQQ